MRSLWVYSRRMLGFHSEKLLKKSERSKLQKFSRENINKWVKHKCKDQFSLLFSNSGASRKSWRCKWDERFHQAIKGMEKIYKGRWNRDMIANYYFLLQLECSGKTAGSTRKWRKRIFSLPEKNVFKLLIESKKMGY